MARRFDTAQGKDIAKGKYARKGTVGEIQQKRLVLLQSGSYRVKFASLITLAHFNAVGVVIYETALP